ncbi:hypothetical protein BJX99DRAFT_232664 [Aspergillus californicus]
MIPSWYPHCDEDGDRPRRWSRISIWTGIGSFPICSASLIASIFHILIDAFIIVRRLYFDVYP